MLHRYRYLYEGIKVTKLLVCSKIHRNVKAEHNHELCLATQGFFHAVDKFFHEPNTSVNQKCLPIYAIARGVEICATESYCFPAI